MIIRIKYVMEKREYLAHFNPENIYFCITPQQVVFAEVGHSKTERINIRDIIGIDGYFTHPGTGEEDFYDEFLKLIKSKGGLK